MTVYDIIFADGGFVRETLSPTGTESFRLANGGKSNIDLLIEQVQRKHPNRDIKKIIRCLTGKVIWTV